MRSKGGDLDKGASKGDREGATKEVGGRPGEVVMIPVHGEMNSYMLLRSKEDVV